MKISLEAFLSLILISSMAGEALAECIASPVENWLDYRAPRN